MNTLSACWQLARRSIIRSSTSFEGVRPNESTIASQLGEISARGRREQARNRIRRDGSQTAGRSGRLRPAREHVVPDTEHRATRTRKRRVDLTSTQASELARLYVERPDLTTAQAPGGTVRHRARVRRRHCRSARRRATTGTSWHIAQRLRRDHRALPRQNYASR